MISVDLDIGSASVSMLRRVFALAPDVLFASFRVFTKLTKLMVGESFGH